MDPLSYTKLHTGPDVVPLAGDWGAAGHIHWGQWQSSTHSVQSGGKDGEQRKSLC